MTKREGQVRRHLTYGLHDPEIAKSLAISIMTMKEHVQNLMQKKDVKDRTKAAVWAIDG